MLIIQCADCKVFVKAPSKKNPVSEPCECGHTFEYSETNGHQTIRFNPRPAEDNKTSEDENSKKTNAGSIDDRRV